MKWKIKFKEELYNELNDYLFELSPKENGCFLLANQSNKNLFVTEILYPKLDNWIKRDIDKCEPSAEYISDACIEADTKNKSLIFIHSHPLKHHLSKFSKIDKYSNKLLFQNLSEIIDNPIGSIVFSRKGINGLIYSGSKMQKIESYTVVGEHMAFIFDVDSKLQSLDFEEYDRQRLFIGDSDLSVLSNLNIAIVGLGGIGSPLSVMLAKMGFRKLSFFDFDKVEVHNLPRIYGANKNSIGKYKVDVVKKHLESFIDDIKIKN